MKSAVLSLRVEFVPYSGGFAWVILDHESQDDPVEIAASLWSYRRASEALAAGESVLRLTAASSV
ncbi:hypothetical protein ACSFA7_21775 [Variovorax sp. LT1R20]|uniref:hypothetical protein n=1 Tax=Variovorax sp. LT1R20 TaxID=3443729 RepID=UPI003F4479C0